MRKEFNFDGYFRLSIIVSETKAFDYFISAELSEMTKHGKKTRILNCPQLKKTAALVKETFCFGF